MTAKRNYGFPVYAAGGPGRYAPGAAPAAEAASRGPAGKPGAAPAAEAASRMASATGPTPDSVGNEAQEPATTSVLSEEREPEAADSPHRYQPEVDGAGRDGQPEPEPEPEPELEFDLEALVAKAEQADAYLELARRTKADFENYRKRAARESAAAQDRGVAKLALALLPAVDNLDRAVAAADSQAGGPPTGAVDGVDTLVSGIKLVHADVIAALARVGIEPFSPVGEQFDPQHHEAVAQQIVEGATPGTVAEVYQRGYRLGDSVLRPARVLVAG